ncbi:TPR-like protein, partial [Tilletiaria anomala UBC 951]
LKAEANEAFAKGQWDRAVCLYDDAIALLPARHRMDDEGSDDSGDEMQAQDKGKGKATVEEEGELKTPAVLAEEQEVSKLRATLYCNMAACHLKLEQYKVAVAACGEALLDAPGYVKALHRRATANEHIGNWSGVSSALDDLKVLLTLKDTPASLRPSIRNKIAQLEPMAKQLGEKEKDEMVQKLKGIGDSILGHFGLSTKNFKFKQQAGGGYSMDFIR